MKSNNFREVDHPEEILDLVDEQDKVIGTSSRKEIYAQDLRNYRVINAFIVNSEGKIWTPRRNSTKVLCPNGLDFSFGGHVESGETYEEALLKEAREEVNLDLSQVPYTEIGYFNPYTHDVHCFQKLYEIKNDSAPHFNTDDFSSYEWLTPQEIIDKADSGEPMKSDIPEILRLCYFK